MGPGARGALTVALAGVLGVGVASAGLPERGTLVPGTSLGGVRLGMSKADVERVWGERFGRCRPTDCRRETWYFTYRAFAPEGAGVVFERGRVVQAFTLWQPSAWRTTRGLALGADAGRIAPVHGPLTRRDCAGYYALVVRSGRVTTAFYVRNDELWGFGLARTGESPCV